MTGCWARSASEGFLAATAAQARRVASGDRTNAISKLAAALGLWRGTAGDGLPAGTSLQAQLASLEDQRWTVSEDLVEARLLTGKYPRRQPIYDANWLTPRYVNAAGPC